MAKRKTGIDAAAWFYGQSFHSTQHLTDSQKLAEQRINQAAQPKSTIVERWNGEKWIEKRLVWDGKSYV